MKTKIIFLNFLAFSFGSWSVVRAATVTAVSCAEASVQTAIGQAADGDTVLIPPCTETLWPTTLSINLTSKSIHLQGSGQASTIISVGADPGMAITSADGRTFTLSDLQFIHEAAGERGIVTVGGTSKSWRIHDLTFVMGGKNNCFYVHGFTYGVVDHITASGVGAEFIKVDGDDWPSWRRPQVWGDGNAVFIEDCTITWTNRFQGAPVVDGERGGRAVFRHNIVTNSQVGGHGFDSGYDSGMLSVEVYNNNFTITDAPAGVDSSWSVLGQMRGGTGLWHDNAWQLGGAVWVNAFGPNLQLYRISGGFNWGVCDGTARNFCSNVDINYNFLTGDHPGAGATATECAANTLDSNATPKWKFCSNNRADLCQMDSDCSGGGTCSTYLDGVGSNGYPCRMQPGFTTEMVSSPVYGWNNKYYRIPGDTATGGNVGNCSQASPCTAEVSSNASLIQENRDFFNSALTGYSPYVYPHPLVVPPTPAAPVVTYPPQNQTVAPGQTASFIVLVTGYPSPTYQWLKDGVAISGATNARYTTPVTILADSGSKFSCTVTNPSGSATSPAATLLVSSSGSNPGAASLIPAQFLPFKNVFNPTMGSLAIKFLAAGSGVSLSVYDRLGTEVRKLSSDSGGQSAWDGRNTRGDVVSSGTYILVFKQAGTVLKKKVVVVK